MTDLVVEYVDYLDGLMDEKGFQIAPALATRKGDAGLCVFALAVPPPEAYLTMLGFRMTDDPDAMIFALDRHGREGQGTTQADLMAGHFYERGKGWRSFIVEYRWEPKLVMPVNWDNDWWNRALRTEMTNASLLLADEVVAARARKRAADLGIANG